MDNGNTGMKGYTKLVRQKKILIALHSEMNQPSLYVLFSPT
jgi:hypothetical protein